MKRLLKVVAVVVLVLVALFVAAKVASGQRLGKTYETHRAEFAVPFSLTETERAEIGEADPAAVALERAVASGRHLIVSRYGCTECHGKDFGGGTMIDAPPVGRFFGPNLTAGKGSVVSTYTTSDWDRIVRHGVLPNGTPAIMPSGDFAEVSDRELSDMIAYIRSLPPVDREMPKSSLGPVMVVMSALGKTVVSAERTELHQRPHVIEPPATAESLEFGKHLVMTCTGCHGEDLSGGPIVGGDPSWPPAANLTPHTEGLAGWSGEDFGNALLHARSKDGRELRMPMKAMTAFAANMSSTELKAMWGYLQSLPAKTTPGGKIASSK